jgi:hypothetical protein
VLWRTCWGTHRKPYGNSKGTQRELKGNIMGTHWELPLPNQWHHLHLSCEYRIMVCCPISWFIYTPVQ